MLTDRFGEVHFHLVPYCDPSIVKHLFEEDDVVDHHSAMEKVVERIRGKMDEAARHVFVGHAFVTPQGEEEENTSDSERPLAIGGAEYVAASLFTPFNYTALGHLHQAHYVLNEKIRYAGSPMKYSISEERHAKGFYIVDMDGDGNVDIEKKLLTPLHDMRTVEGTIEEILMHPPSNDFVFVKLHDETPVLFPMEKVKSVYPNVMHIERKLVRTAAAIEHQSAAVKDKPDDMTLFRFFYSEMNDMEPDAETERIFAEVLQEVKGGIEK